MPETPREYVQRYIRETADCLSGPYLADGITQLVDVMVKARDDGRFIFFFGNGGSASTASHMAQDIAKLTIVEGKKRWRCLSLADPVSLILAWANDKSYAEIFAEQIHNNGSRGDVALGISGSGNSPNVLRGLEEARKLGLTTVGLIGSGGGKMKALCDVSLIVPSSNMQHIEDLHHLALHCLAAYLRDERAK